MANKKEVAVEVIDIHKEFILPQHKNSSFKQTVVNIVKQNNKVTQKVLDGVSFNVNKGDFFGIVGRNGSGKSTLLKLIAGVYSPTEGEIKLHGGLTPFIELGVGFNPELSGRDNVYLNGALLGFDRKQMDTMYDEIVEFAELEPFMDQKLKNYSSGMQVRLAFSIAIKAKNDILIFDEVLAVGDEAFQRKCLDVFEQYKSEGQTVILVTHDMETVRKYCSRAVLIHDGKLIEDANPRKVADTYSALNQKQIDDEIIGKKIDKNTHDNIGLQVAIKDIVTQKNVHSFAAGTPIKIGVAWKRPDNIDAFIVNIFKKSGEHVTAFRVHIKDSHVRSFCINLKPLLGVGKYILRVEVRDSKDRPVCSPYEGSEFTITSQDVQDVPPWSGITFISHTVTYDETAKE